MGGTEETRTADWSSGSGTGQTIGIGRLVTEGAEGWVGDIAEVALWNVKLSAAQRAMLAVGCPPLMVAPESLVHYWRVTGSYSTEPDLVGGLSGTITGTSATSNPRMYYPATMQGRRFTTAAGGGLSIPVAMAQYRQRWN